MKLELKHLAPYLPYELELVARNVVSETPKRIFGKLNSMNIMSLVENDTLYKPILRPMSDIREQIIIKNKIFLPIEEMFKMFNDASENIYSTGEFTINNAPLWIDYSHSKVSQKGEKVSLYTGYILNNSYTKIDILISWHFDVFGLIEKGLAISIHDVYQADA